MVKLENNYSKKYESNNRCSNKIELTVLGTQSPYAKEKNACPSFLLQYKNHKVLLDCGSGSHRFFPMQDMENLCIIISHFHRDHYNDIYNYLYSSYVYKNQKKLTTPIQLYLPNKPKSIYNDIKNAKLSFSTCKKISKNQTFKFGDFIFEFIKIKHSNHIVSFATKIKTDNKTIIYTGDCSYKSKEEISEFANNCDLLICESSLLKKHEFPKYCNHLTAEQAGEIAKEAKAKKLILTHFWPNENTQNYLIEAKNVFKNVFIAKEKEKFII